VQIRIGLKSKPFKIYKFRTMKLGTPELATHLLQNPSSYILFTGKFLRKFSLDELPNLFNILKGEMVFVGPRPALHNQYDLIELRKKEGIDKVKPGITGWAQVNGRDELSIEDKIKFDKEYIQRKSFLFDLRILFLTLYNVILRSGIKH
jgi:O-antigen biosynthesis protein WbqP